MSIHQEVLINCRPEMLYKALTNAKDFAAATGAPAVLEPTAGRVFSAFDGQITGRNIELIDDKLLVQAWRVGSWPEGVYSIVRIELEQKGEETKLTLDHTAYPPDAEVHLEAGWHNMYWKPLKAHCE